MHCVVCSSKTYGPVDYATRLLMFSQWSVHQVEYCKVEDIFIVSDTSEYLHLIAEEKCHKFVLSTETVHGNKIEEFSHLNLWSGRGQTQ